MEIHERFPNLKGWWGFNSSIIDNMHNPKSSYTVIFDDQTACTAHWTFQSDDGRFYYYDRDKKQKDLAKIPESVKNFADKNNFRYLITKLYRTLTIGNDDFALILFNDKRDLYIRKIKDFAYLLEQGWKVRKNKSSNPILQKDRVKCHFSEYSQQVYYQNVFDKWVQSCRYIKTNLIDHIKEATKYAKLELEKDTDVSQYKIEISQDKFHIYKDMFIHTTDVSKVGRFQPCTLKNGKVKHQSDDYNAIKFKLVSHKFKANWMLFYNNDLYCLQKGAIVPNKNLTITTADYNFIRWALKSSL